MAGDFLKKLNLDRSKRQAYKEREQSVGYNQRGPKLYVLLSLSKMFDMRT